MITGIIKITRYVLMLTGIIASVPVSNQDNPKANSKSVVLKIIEIGCPERTWDEVDSDTSIIVVCQGNDFGGNGAPYYFRLLEITDSNTIKVLFTDDLVIVGEPVNYPSTRNPVTISDEQQCFRVRHPEAGHDFCIEILKTNKNSD